MIFGDKSVFAYQVEDVFGSFCKFCFWVYDNQYGTLQDTCYIPSFLNQLRNFRLPASFDAETDDQVLKYFKSKTLGAKYLISLDPTFDEFGNRYCLIGDTVFLYWKMSKKTFFTYPDSAKEGLFKIPLNVWQSVIDRAIAQLHNARS